MTTAQREELSPDDSKHLLRVAPRRVSVLGIVTAAAGALVLVLAITSLSWPRYHDGALMEYLAWSIRHGNRPYVDLFDMQFPGTYIFYGVGQYIFGTGDVSFRVRDLIVLATGCYAMFRLLRPFGNEAASVAVVLLTTRYLVYGGAEQSLQRDWLVALLVIGAIALLMDDNERGWKLVTAGAFLGYACTIKPHAVVFLALAPIVVLLADRGRSTTEAPRTTIGALGRCGLVVAGAIVIIGAIIGWLVVSGSWSAFVWMATRYLPLYTHLDSGGHELGSTGNALRSSFTLARGRPEVPLLGFGALVLLLRRRPADQAARLVALALVLLAGFAYAVLEIKNWPYHFWPFVLANVALVAVAISDLRARRWASWNRPVASWASKICSLAFLFCFFREVGFTARAASNQLSANQHVFFRDLLPRPWLLALFLPIVLLAVADVAHASVFSVFHKVDAAGSGSAWVAAVVVTVALPFLIGSVSAVSIIFDRNGTAAFSSPYVAGITSRNEYVGELLRSRARPGDRVQILDTTGGAADIAFRAGLQPASRFVEDFHFYHDVGSAVNAKLRRELMSDLLRNQPRFILFFRRSWYVRLNYDDVARFPELARYLTSYRIIFEDGDMRVLEHA